MRHLYSLFMYLLSPFLIARLGWKSLRLPAYRKRIGERFMLAKHFNQPIDIWIHAVSLGEVIAVSPLITALLEKKWQILVTTMTPTGSAKVQNQFADKVLHQYIPYDLSLLQKQFFKQTKPRIGLIIETELWPNMIYQAKKANIPLLLLNGRLSERSFKNYQKIGFFFKALLNQFSAIYSQSDEDAARFTALGARKDLVSVLGNMKFDLEIPQVMEEKYLELQSRWGKDRAVVIAASTHPGEEAQLLDNLKFLQKNIANLVLLIAPRHPERFQAVYNYCCQQGFNTGLRSNPASLMPENEIVILDSLGELMGWYSLSDFAFVGGSFVSIGGHNVLEPIAAKIPVFSGPFVHNFKTICRELSEAKAIRMVENAQQLMLEIIELYQNPDVKNQQVERASCILIKNKGAVLRYVAEIEKFIHSSK